MSGVSRRLLKFLAALTWLTGGVILLLKGVGLVLEVRALEQTPAWTWVVVLTGLMVGVIRGDPFSSEAAGNTWPESTRPPARGHGGGAANQRPRSLDEIRCLPDS